jgi:two-component system phosphate regulon response regulator PhoB
MSSHILIVEDEEDLLENLDYNLTRDGFITRTATTGARAIELAAEPPLPDLVLLDLMLPDISGTEVCRALRARTETARVPIIIITAKGEEIDRVVGFEVGADDYVVKPFSIRELGLRIRAVLRRSASAQPTEDEAATVFGRLRVDASGHRVWVDAEEVTLTALEFRLLTTLLARRGRVQTRDTLLRDVWGIHADLTTRTVDTHVKRLRSKLGPAGDYVETLRGVGYRMRSSPSEERA